MAKTLVEMAAEIIQAQGTTKDMSIEEMQAALNKTFETRKHYKNSSLVRKLLKQKLQHLK